MAIGSGDNTELIESLKRTLQRERMARKSAEEIIEQKSLEIFRTNQELKELNESLEQRIEERTQQIESSNEQLIEARDRAEQATKAKSIFLSNMSHEIRTPLNGIIGISDLLLKKHLGQEVLDMLHSVKYSADNLLVIINDILDFSKIEAGKITFEKINFNLPTLVNRLYETFIFKANEKNIELKIGMNADENINIVGDKVKLNQILINLIGNALKFTETGSVGLKVNQEKEKGGRCKVHFKIIDTGIGIPPEKKESIFKSFAQSDLATTRKYGGTGLGLTITKKLVELQGGTITVESTPGRGSTFFVTMPFDLAEKMKQKETVEQEDFPPFEKTMKILVVEDNAINQFVVVKLLKEWNLMADVANNGKEALEYLKQYHYRLVLMDLQMPVMDGIDATKRIRRNGADVLWPEIPIIGLSANAFAEVKEKVMKAGMNDFTTKPIQQKDLYALIEKYAKPE